MVGDLHRISDTDTDTVHEYMLMCMRQLVETVYHIRYNYPFVLQVPECLDTGPWDYDGVGEVSNFPGAHILTA